MIHTKPRLVSVESRGVDITPRQKLPPLHPHEPEEGLNIPDSYFYQQARFAIGAWMTIGLIVILLFIAIVLAIVLVLHPVEAGKIHAEWYDVPVERHVEFKEELVRRVCLDCQVAFITSKSEN